MTYFFYNFSHFFVPSLEVHPRSKLILYFSIQQYSSLSPALKCYYDKNHVFSIEAILRHKQVACLRRKILFTIFKYLFLFQRYSSFLNMQISLVMTSYFQPSFDQI